MINNETKEIITEITTSLVDKFWEILQSKFNLDDSIMKGQVIDIFSHTGISFLNYMLEFLQSDFINISDEKMEIIIKASYQSLIEFRLKRKTND